MPPRHAFDAVFQIALPLPVARLYARAHHAKGDRERHDHAFHLIEASLKLAAAAVVARYRARGERSAKVDAALRNLARPSLGQWRSILLEGLGFLADGVSGDSWARGILEKLRRSSDDLGEAFSRLAKAAAFKGRAIAHPTAIDLLELLPTYRNAMSDAHGGIKADPAAYREPTPALLALAHALLEDAALLGSGRLVHAEEVRIGLQGEERVQWMDLTGTTAMRRQPMEGEVVKTRIFPGRLYLEIAGGEHLALYPLVHYEPGEVLDQVFFLNRAREGAGGIQFLSYSTGEFYMPGRDPVGDALLSDLKELLSWVTRTTVDASCLEELATASQADARNAGEAGAQEREPSGTVLGDFEILGELGRGGMAVVYLARQMSLNRQVALKVMPPAFGNDPVARARFKQEVRALSRCDHPNVVKILSSGEARGTHYYAMEFIDGGDLAVIGKTLKGYQSSGMEVLREEHFDRAASSASSKPASDRGEGLPEVGKLPKMPVDGIPGTRNIAFCWAAVIRDAARGVEHIHEHGIVHRDLKPQNIMVTRSEHRPVVMDLGLAKVSDVSRSLTFDKGSILGTLRYMPPEQLQRNLLEVDARADVYALGAVLYEMVCLRPMLDGDTEERLTTQILFEEPPPPQKVNPRIPTDLATVIAKATRKDPKDRYASAGELAEDLDRFVHGEAVSAKPPTLKYLLGLFVRRHRAAVIAGVLAVLLFASSLMYWIVSLKAAWESERKATLIAEERLAKVLRLSDVKRLAECTAEAEGLWPCVPEKVADMERWLAGARELYGRLEEHRLRLAALRERALPPDAEALAKEGERRPEAEKVANVRRWAFADQEAAWQHDLVAELVDGLEKLGEPEKGLIADVEGRLDFARTVKARTIDDVKAKWDAAIASIGNREECPKYEGLVIEPQLGLLPIGRDPRSGLWEFAHLQTGEVPERGPDGSLVIKEETGVVFVLIPGGTFRMGAERARLGIQSRPQDGRLLVERILEGSLATSMGLQVGDIVLSVNGQPVRSPEDVLKTLGPLATGEKVALEVNCGGETNSLSAELGPNVDPFADQNEGPVHAVTLSPFFVSKYETTQGQWLRVMRKNPSAYWPGLGEVAGRKIDLRHPVEQVSWDDCRACATRLGLGVGLPTEAQWEYAARAGTRTVWWTGNEKKTLQGAANVVDKCWKEHGGTPGQIYDEDIDDGSPVPAPVGIYAPNAFGLYDTAGNVAEWCQDLYGKYHSGSVKDPGGAEGGSTRVTRGGSWGNVAWWCRSASRTFQDSVSSGTITGVRFARTISPIE